MRHLWKVVCFLYKNKQYTKQKAKNTEEKNRKESPVKEQNAFFWGGIDKDNP